MTWYAVIAHTHTLKQQNEIAEHNFELSVLIVAEEEAH